MKVRTLSGARIGSLKDKEKRAFESEFNEMKLSEAIKIGIKKSKPLRGELVKTNGQVKACALGCAGLGAIRDFEINPSYTRLFKEFPALRAIVKFEGRRKSLENWIFFLNDERGMARKKIANWVEAQGY